ncbi:MULTISPECIES: DUF3035 domain-containing protein [unclassified Sphingomonas]|uniref:DUF3035 domain-containing protein n=1 Tax=unclassified Sphingomonas TaxID=196159 RepID=UPI000BC77974|nr:MAG: hypothetical protein B7Z43_10610 [Sphingomonas sp. 12-62-6]OYX38500.1 MAG: hypothetical protein B7Y98_08585 [Sphingomonas sp. 32-62-10]OYY66464.1 MAG: hypothetical protein B7Y49_02470 [Sphingomonas sp. 28-62-11]
MRKLTGLVLGLGLTVFLSACGGGSGLNRARPDEFAVARQAPLVIPPDYSLTPPKPGAARPQDTGPSALALEAMFGGAAARSASESALLRSAGNDVASPGIRSDVGDPETTVVDKGSTTRDIVAAPEGDGQAATTSTPK